MNQTLADRQKGIRKTVTIALTIAAMFVGALAYTLLHPPAMSIEELRNHGGYMFEKGRIMQDFSLVDDQGEVFDNKRVEGKWSIVFFGFTHCPDICPTTLAQLSDFYRELPQDILQDTQIIMVSADPDRDTPEILNSYVRYFHPEFVGVTGDFFAIHRFATQLNTTFRKVAGETPDDYQVDHGANLALINPYGHFQGFIKPPFDGASLELNYSSMRTLFNDMH
jgi:protein SCO1/2